MNLCRFQTCFYSWRSAGGPSMCHYGFFDTMRVSFASSKWKIPTSYKASLANVIIPRYALCNKCKFYDKGDLNDKRQLQTAHLSKGINPPLHKRCLDVSMHVVSWLMWRELQLVFMSNALRSSPLEISRRHWLELRRTLLFLFPVRYWNGSCHDVMCRWAFFSSCLAIQRLFQRVKCPSKHLGLFIEVMRCSMSL